MAEAVVSSVVSQLANLLLQEAGFLHGVRDQIEWVKTELQTLRGFLKDADSRRKRGDERMENWISGLRGVAYEMEDVIDTINYMRERRHQRRGFIGSISRYSQKPCDELITLRKISSRIERIKIKIQNISERKDRYGIADLGESSAVDESLQSLRQSSPHFDDDDIDVIGFENDNRQLVSQLLDQNVKTRCVISIVGMGGLGKTTLARKLYNDPAIREHFVMFAWVSISQSYRVIELVKDIMKKLIGIKKKNETTTGITVEDLEQMDEEEVRKMVSDFLRGKNYLVVLDDVWTVDVWRKMQRFFPDENNGSRILLTTREMGVANRAESWFPPHQLHTLNDAESLQLLRSKAFPPKQDVPIEFEELAKKLAKKCGGLPLALVVLGGLLLGRGRNYDAWCSVDKSINWESSGDGQECFNILGLSYKDLKYTLKPCFLYIAVFPEDSTISASKLVRLWIAEGFIPQEQTRTMEETARDCLDELVQRCMIQVVERSVAYGRVKSIRIHDMLRDFGLSEAKKDGFLNVCSSDDMAVSDVISSHRAAFHNRINDKVANYSPHLRTLLGFNLVLKDGTAAGRFLNGLNLLRVLDLEGSKDLKKLPKQIGNMIHLRYLGLRNTGLERLPSFVGHLLNLQTLDVRRTWIKWLPKSFWKIRMLRHIYINKWCTFVSAPIIGEHQNLRTLQIMNIYYHMDIDVMVRLLGMRLIKKWVITPGFTKDTVRGIFKTTFIESLEKALKKMDSLVSLSLNYFSIPVDILFARAPNLHHLRSLTLDGELLLKPQQLPDNSQFPPNLIKLILNGSKLEEDPMPVLEKLPKLRFLNLKFESYLGKSMSCSSASGFPQLQHLILEFLENLEELRVEVGAMPSLTHLTISWCPSLKMLPEGLQHVTTLRELKLRWMPREFNDRVRNEDGYKVQHIPSIIFEDLWKHNICSTCKSLPLFFISSVISIHSTNGINSCMIEYTPTPHVGHNVMQTIVIYFFLILNVLIAEFLVELSHF